MFIYIHSTDNQKYFKNTHSAASSGYHLAMNSFFRKISLLTSRGLFQSKTKLTKKWQKSRIASWPFYKPLTHLIRFYECSVTIIVAADSSVIIVEADESTLMSWSFGFKTQMCVPKICTKMKPDLCHHNINFV